MPTTNKILQTKMLFIAFQIITYMDALFITELNFDSKQKYRTK